MTAVNIHSGAPAACNQDWDAINWHDIEQQVRRLQMRIAKAFREKKYGKAKALQWLLTHSHHAKLFAVKRVVTNKGAKTPGVDKVIWTTPKQKMRAALTLRRRGYQPLPLRRIYIPKKHGGKLRPLSIPVMKCRAMQALHLLALEPIAEIKADRNSYGFRPLRSAADAIAQCFNSLSRQTAAAYILEADIKSCFDKISHQWLLENIPTDKEILKKWLEAGYIEKGEKFSTMLGTPQGGLISPTLLTITLSGLELAVREAVSKRKHKVNFIIYADDFVITGVTKEILEEKVKPIVEKFLHERGLSLSKEKTKITHINEGFDFLGFNIRKFGKKLIITPSKISVKSLLSGIRKTIKLNKTAKQENLTLQLNPKIRGWTNYFHHVCAKKTFSYIDHHIFKALWRWAKRRHPNKNMAWIKKRYFQSTRTRDWIFANNVKQSDGEITTAKLFDASSVQIKRHVKIKADATPYDPTYFVYLRKRTGTKYGLEQLIGSKAEWSHKTAFGRLERSAGKPARCVLVGATPGNGSGLPNL